MLEWADACSFSVLCGNEHKTSPKADARMGWRLLFVRRLMLEWADVTLPVIYSVVLVGLKLMPEWADACNPLTREDALWNFESWCSNGLTLVSMSTICVQKVMLEWADACNRCARESTLWVRKLMLEWADACNLCMRKTTMNSKADARMGWRL